LDKAQKKICILNRVLAISLFFACFFVFSLTLSRKMYGYEIATLDYFRKLFYLGSLSGRTPAGFLAIAAFLPAEIFTLIFSDPLDFISRDFISLHTIPLVTSLICIIFYFAALDIYKSFRTAVSLTLILAFTTMIWPYSKMGMELQHTLWILFTMWMIIRIHEKKGSLYFYMAGMGAGLILFTKLYGFITAGVFVFFILLDGFIDKKNRKHLPLNFIRFLIPLIIFFILLLIYNKISYGGWLLGDRYNMKYEAKSVPVWRPLWGFLFSSGKSIFIYNPTLIAALCCFPAFFSRKKRLKPLYIMIIAVGLLFHSLLWIWTDETWGPRKLHYLIPLCMLPMGIIVEKFHDLSIIKRASIILLVILGVIVQILGISISYQAQPVLLRDKRISSLEDIRYNPRLSQTVINYNLLQSSIDKYLTGVPHYFKYDPTYFVTVKPENPPAPLIFNLRRFSKLDFWFIENRKPSKGGFYLSSGGRFYLSFLLIIIPLIFLLLYILSIKSGGENIKLKRFSPLWFLVLFCLFGFYLCFKYNKAYAKDYKKFTEFEKDKIDRAIGNYETDQLMVGGGWRGCEWMMDPDNSDFEIPFRWTIREKAFLYLPAKPNTDYDLYLEFYFHYPNSISIIVNGHLVGYEKGAKRSNLKSRHHISAEIIGSSHISEICIRSHKLNIPAEIEPEKTNDPSILGVMVYGVVWEKVK
jgi:hypothetical protein